MSVTASYWRLGREEWSRLEIYLTAQPGTEIWREGEQAFVSLISEERMASDRYLDLQTEWHILHCYSPTGGKSRRRSPRHRPRSGTPCGEGTKRHSKPMTG